MSYNQWNYVESNPINLTDPSGKSPSQSGNYPRYCQSMPTKAQYEACVLTYFDLEAFDPNRMGETVSGSKGCYIGPEVYRAPGYLEGISYTFGPSYTGGGEIVYDFATMQRERFKYHGWGFQYTAGFADAQYIGIVKGFKNSFGETTYNIDGDYSGPFDNTIIGASGGEGLSIGLGVNLFQSPNDPLIRGTSVYIGATLGANLIPASDLGKFRLNYEPIYLAPHDYVSGDTVNVGALMNDIYSGKDSPLLWFGGITPGATHIYRAQQMSVASKYVFAYQALRWQKAIGW
jgi:hypothetical protein